jgi:hypothetical protein
MTAVVSSKPESDKPDFISIIRSSFIAFTVRHLLCCEIKKGGARANMEAWRRRVQEHVVVVKAVKIHRIRVS